jgi:polysaccharide biosynthesis transport protein
MNDQEPRVAEIVAFAPEPTALARPGEGSHGLAAAGRVLRGRYGWAIGMASVLATAGVVAGALLPKPVYKSVGLIDVAPKVPKVVYDTDEKGLLPMFDAYVASQAATLSTRRVVDAAMESEAWRKFGRGRSDEAIASFQSQLAVTHPKYTEHVEVTFLDRNPDAAQTAVNEVINAYMKIIGENEDKSGAALRRQLENQRDLVSSRMQELNTNTWSVTENLGDQALEERWKASIAQLNKLDAAISDLDVEIATLRAATETDKPVESRVPTAQQIALRDPNMAGLLREKAAAEDRVNWLVNHEQLGAKAADLVEARQRLASIEKRVDEWAKAYVSSIVRDPDTRAADLREKETRRGKLAELRDGVQEDTRKLGIKRMKLAAIAQEQALQTETFESVKKRLEQIDVEAGVHGRINVISMGDRPVEPETDRRLPMACLGAGGGIALGFGLVLLWGMREGKLRYVVDVDGNVSKGRFLGVVPDVTDEAGPDAQTHPADMGDFCVHHVRTMLQLRADRKKTVVALTSPSPGAGKTTLSLALGTSFAATGARTLIVDCDFVGHGLTSAMRSIACDRAVRALAGAPAESERSDKSMRRRIVLPLVEARRLAYDDAHIAELLAAARERAAGGEDSFDDTARSLDALARSEPKQGDRKLRGVAGVLAGRPLAECVVQTDAKNLAILPVGDSTAADAEGLSQSSIEKLVEICRERYDVVLVDSGPVLGSIEAVFTTTAADAVVVVVSRGDRRPVVDQTLARLERIGADVAGVVFNRASSADVAQSSYASRSTSRVAAA